MSKDYQVGYAKPPKHTQFKKGQSGNPSGRPEGTKNLKTDLAEELAEQILIREGDRALTVSKQRAMVKSLLNKALKGDVRAATAVLGMMSRLLDTAGMSEAGETPLSADEGEVWALLKERLGHPTNMEKNEDTTIAGKERYEEE